jgi:tRNA-Thr(GGU) m(6)t(6)A37 methyltransferase TsaA
MELLPVGMVRSAIKGRKQMPVWGAPASVEILPRFEPALLHIEKHSHFWIFGWLGDPEPERGVLQVTPRGVSDTGPGGLHGVFAVRAPARPNPIGLTVARLTGREGLRLDFDRLDFVDGTIVVDLKPYFITRDLIFSANGRQVGQPRSAEELRVSLWNQALHYSAAASTDLALGVRIIEHYRSMFRAMCDVEEWDVAVPLARPLLVDSLVSLTRTTPGRGNLHFPLEDRVVICREAEYRPLGSLPENAEAVLSAKPESLFVFRDLR